MAFGALRPRAFVPRHVTPAERSAPWMPSPWSRWTPTRHGRTPSRSHGFFLWCAAAGAVNPSPRKRSGEGFPGSSPRPLDPRTFLSTGSPCALVVVATTKPIGCAPPPAPCPILCLRSDGVSLCSMCFAPLGLEFFGDARPDPGLHPGLCCFAPSGRTPHTQALTHGCRKDTKVLRKNASSSGGGRA